MQSKLGHTADRILGLDIIRSIAVLFVLSVHFFLNVGFYSTAMVGIKMFLMTNMRWLFFTCVPLFMLLTGYLKSNKKVEKASYTSLIPIVTSYLFIAVISVFFQIFYLHTNSNPIQWFFSIFNFSANAYSWYVNMYIGFALLIPFLNILYHGIDTKKKKQILILIMLFITALLPLYWSCLYPFSYYLVGAYMKEYQPKFKKKKIVCLIIAIVLTESLIAYQHCYQQLFKMDLLNNYNALPTAAVAVLLFLLFYDVNVKNKIIRFAVTNLSKCSFDIYLFSYLLDTVIYRHLNQLFPHAHVQALLPYFFVTVPLSLLGSYFLSILKRVLFSSIKNRRLTL